MLHSQSIDQDEHRKIITNQPSLLQPLYLTESFLTEFGFHIKFLKGEILQLAKFHDLHCSSICILFFIHLLTVRCPVLVFPIWWQHHFSSTATKIMTVQKVNFSPICFCYRQAHEGQKFSRNVSKHPRWSLALGLYVWAASQGKLLHGCRAMNSGSHICTANTLPTHHPKFDNLRL